MLAMLRVIHMAHLWLAVRNYNEPTAVRPLMQSTGTHGLAPSGLSRLTLGRFYHNTLFHQWTVVALPMFDQVASESLTLNVHCACYVSLN